MWVGDLVDQGVLGFGGPAVGLASAPDRTDECPGSVPRLETVPQFCAVP
jgi:hypothetical protein